MRIGIFHRTPRIGVLNALRAEALLRPRHVGRGVRGLHGGDDAEFREPWNIFRREHLRMLDAQPRIVCIGRGLLGLFVSIQRAAIRGVADGMRTNLKTCSQRPIRQIVDFCLRSGHHAVGLHSVAIRFEQRRPARTERTIRKKLESANCELVMRINGRAALQPFVDEVFVRAVEHGVSAQRHACTEVSPFRAHSRAAS